MMKFRITVLTIIFSQNLIQVSDGMGKPPHPPGHGRSHCLGGPHHSSHSSHHTSHGSHHPPHTPTHHLPQPPPEPRRRCFSDGYSTLYDNVRSDESRSRSLSYSPPRPLLRDEDILRDLVDDPWAKFSESCEGGVDSTPPPRPCRPRSRIRLELSFGRGRDRDSSPEGRQGRSSSRGRKPKNKKPSKKEEDDDGWEDASNEFTYVRCTNR